MMKSKYVNWLQAVYYKTRKSHRHKIVCEECGSVLIAMVKSFKDKIECPSFVRKKVIMIHVIMESWFVEKVKQLA